MTKLSIPVFTSVLVLSAPISFAQAQSAQVTAWAQHIGAHVVYRYEVKNASTSPLQRLLIGHSSQPQNGRAELSVPPASSSLDDGSLWLPTDVASSPPGWGVAMNFPEESSAFSLEWIDAELNRRLWPSSPLTRNSPVLMASDAAIPPGGASTAFSVRVPRLDPAYVNGNATLGYAEGSVSVPLQRGDSVAPTLRLTVERLNQNGTRGNWAIFDIAATVTDNYDPAPTVDLAILSNGLSPEPGSADVSRQGMNWKVKLKITPGRSYELRFTAEDASNNQTTESVRYAVP